VTLGLYLSRILAGRILAVAFVLVALGTSLEVIQFADRLVETGGAGALLTYARLSAPAMLATVLPLAILLGGLTGFLALGLRSELTVIRASGESLFGLLRRLLPLAVMLGALNNVLVDRAPAWSAAALGEAFGEIVDVPAAEAGDRVMSRAGGQVLVARLARPDGTALAPVTVFVLDEGGAVHGRLRADRAVFTGGQWQLADIRRFGHTAGLVSEGAIWRTRLVPGDVRALASGGHVASAAEAAAALSGTAIATRSAAYYRTRIWRARAAVAVPPVMILLSALAAFSMTRGGGLRLAVLGGTLGFCFVAFEGMVASLGQIGMLPAPMAALGPILLAAGAGASILLVKEG